MGPLIPVGPGKPAAPVAPLSPGDPEHAATYADLLYQQYFLAGLTGLYHTFQAPVSLGPPGTPLRWAALTEVKVTLIIIQGVVLRANTRGLRALCIVILKAVI